MGSGLISPLAFRPRHKTRQCQARGLPFGLISHPTDTFLLLSMERMKIFAINAATWFEELQQLDRKCMLKMYSLTVWQRLEVRRHQRQGKNETDGPAINDPPSILARYLAKLGWVGGNYLQLML